MLTPSVSRLFAQVSSVTESARSTSILWITGPSADLQQRLQRIEGLPPSIVLTPHAPADGDALSNEALDLIADTIDCRQVRVILVCGQTAAATVHTDGVARQRASGFDSILQRVGEHAKSRLRAQACVRSRLNRIQSHPRVAQALNRGVVSIHGVYYASECDAFLVYDPESDQFVPFAEMPPA